MKKVKILGLGSFGYALLKHFDEKPDKNYTLTGYAREQKLIDFLKKHQRHLYLFPTISLSPDVQFEKDLKKFIGNTDILILAIASSAIPEVLKKIKGYFTKPFVLVNTAKSLEYHTGERFSQVAKKILKGIAYEYAVFSGGTISADLFKKEPLGADIASVDKQTARDLAKLFNSSNLSVYPTTDVAGVEYAGAFKNVIAILAGVVKGLGFSYGSETFIISRAANEVENLVVNSLGGKRETFSLKSQSWGNDLWMSCTGNTRNREFGILLGKGYSVDEAQEFMQKQRKLVEGMHTIKVLHKLSNMKKYPLLNFLQRLFAGRVKTLQIKDVIFN